MNEIANTENSNITVMPWTPPPATALLLSSIIEVARDTNADIDKITQLIALHDRMKLAAEEEAFDAAMNAAQSEMGRVATDSNNPQTHSKYASYGALDRAVRPIYTKHGFSLMFDTAQAPTPDAVLVTCRVSRGGAHRIFSIARPADGKGARGNDVMSKTHATGSAVSYGRRYLLGMIFNLATGQDDDGVAASGGYRRAPQAAPNVLRKVMPMPAHDPQTGEIHEPVQESVSTPTADPETSSAPTGLEYGAEENHKPPPSAAEYVDRWQAIMDRASTPAEGKQMSVQWNKEKALRNLIIWPDDNTYPDLRDNVRKMVEWTKQEDKERAP